MGRLRQRRRTGDYRIFVGAVPEGQLADQLQHLRQQYDPLTARVSPLHVTLAGTYWREGPSTADNEERLIERLYGLQDRLRPFELILGGIRRFGNRRCLPGRAAHRGAADSAGGTDPSHRAR